MRISVEKFRVIGASAGAVLTFFFLDLYVCAKSHSQWGSICLGITCLIALWVMVLGPGTEIFIPYRRQEYRVSIFLVLLMPALTMLIYLPLVRIFNVDVAARILRYGVREYQSFGDVRTNFHGLIRIRDAHINVPASMYYPPDDEFSGEIYYAIENPSGILEALYIDSIFHRQQDFIDSVGEDNRWSRPLSGFVVNESLELDRCSGVLHDGAIKYAWKNTDNALCLRYVPALPHIVYEGKIFLSIILPLLFAGHILACLYTLRKIP